MSDAAQAIRLFVAESAALRRDVQELLRVIRPKGPDGTTSLEVDAVNKLELVAMRQALTAARRVRMLKGGGDSLHQLGRALDQLDELTADAAPSRPGP